MRRSAPVYLVAVLICLVIGPPCHAKNYSITVTGGAHDARDVIAAAEVDEPAGPLSSTLQLGSAVIPSQVRREGDRTEVVWVLPALQHGAELRYRLRVTPASASDTDEASRGVEVKENGGNLEVRIKGELFTRYDTTTGPNKPYFYPLFGPDQKQVVRGYPIEHLPADVSSDHPHHRGMWFTHGAVNGEDYWSEGPKAAKTVHVRYDDIVSGPVFGGFRATTDWIDREGKKIAEDVREVRVYSVTNGRLMDFAVTIKPTAGPVTFEDTKEGSFGLRLADSMRVAGERGEPGQGHIETSAGIKDGAAWGKRADWVDYYGPVGGETIGVAILDDPKNLRHPTTWHVRDYGLFAANPFGLHDFEKGQAKDAGNYTIPAGSSLTFRYRIFIHKGSTADARIADVWSAYSEPPRVQARQGRGGRGAL